MPWRRCRVALPLAWCVIWGTIGASLPVTLSAANGASQALPAQCFAETGQCVGGRFLTV